jgi:plastocyanin
MHSSIAAVAIAALLVAGLFVAPSLALAGSNSGPGSDNSGPGSSNSGPGRSGGDDDSVSILPAPANATTTSSPANATTTITIPQGAAERDASFFDPDSASVSSGSTVTWINSDNAVHTATADDRSFDTDMVGPGASSSTIIAGSNGQMIPITAMYTRS